MIVTRRTGLASSRTADIGPRTGTLLDNALEHIRKLYGTAFADDAALFGFRLLKHLAIAVKHLDDHNRIDMNALIGKRAVCTREL